MKRYTPLITQYGATLVEVLVAIALAGIMLPALTVAIISSNDARPTASQQLAAEGLLSQLLTATKDVREQGWSNVATDGTYHAVISGNTWSLVSGSGTSGNYTEQIVISDVSRNSSDDVVTTGGSNDPATKLVTATVSWATPTTSSVSGDMYLTRWQNQSSWTQTTVADFNGDTLTNDTVTNTSGGEIELTPGQTSGIVESSTYDAGADTGFDYLSFTDSIPPGTNIQYQIATNNNNSTWNFVGPDGSGTSFYTTPYAIPLDQSSGRYIRWAAALTTTNSSLPVIDDITITYSK